MAEDDAMDLAEAGLDREAMIALINDNAVAIRDGEIVRPPFRPGAAAAAAGEEGAAR